MKNEALTYTLIGVGVPALVWLLAGLRINLIEAGATVGWVAAGALAAMALVEYRPFWKRILGR